MFFRIVSAKYKKKRYHYLRVMESYRKGNKVKQKELMTLTSLNHMSQEKIDHIMNELKKIQVYCTVLNKNSSGCAWISLLVALDIVFQPKKPCPLPILQQILRKNLERRGKPPANKEEYFFDYLQKPYPPITENGIPILYIDKFHKNENSEQELYGYLVNTTGLPLQYFFITKDHSDKEPMDGLNTVFHKAYNDSTILKVIPGDVFNTWAKHFPKAEPELIHNVLCHRPGNELITLTSAGFLPDNAGNVYDYYYCLLKISSKIKSIIGQYPAHPETYMDMCIMAHSLANLIESNIVKKLHLFSRAKKEPEVQDCIN